MTLTNKSGPILFPYFFRTGATSENSDLRCQASICFTHARLLCALEFIEAAHACQAGPSLACRNWPVSRGLGQVSQLFPRTGRAFSICVSQPRIHAADLNES